MPGRDRTGPLGAGPGTGRGMGYCRGVDQSSLPASVSGYIGRFGFRGGGMGRGWRNRFYATGVPGWAAQQPEQEIEDLNNQADWLKRQLDIVQKRIGEIKS